MKATRTTKCKIGEAEHLDKLVVRYLAAACWVSEKVFASKELNSNRLSRAFYGTVRRKFKLPSQLTCSLFRHITGSYKTMKVRGKWNLAVFKRPAMPVTHKRDFARNRNGVSILGETIQPIRPNIPASGWKDSKVKRIGKCWYLLLAHEIEIPEPKQTGSIVGVDMGIKRLLVATNSANSRTFFFKGGVLNHRRTCIRRTRAGVQSVDTRSAHRLLRRMDSHEAAVTGHLTHVASKALVAYAVSVGARRIVFEGLANLRDSSLKKGKNLRSKIHRWPYASAKFKVGYKAAAVGIKMEEVSPVNTSRGCAKCGHVSASNRKGLNFCCQKCGHSDDADRNASVNIRMRSVVASQVGATTGSIKAPQSSEPSDIVAESLVSHGGLVLV